MLSSATLLAPPFRAGPGLLRLLEQGPGLTPKWGWTQMLNASAMQREPGCNEVGWDLLAGRADGEPLKIRLQSGRALLLRVPPGACADGVVQRAAAACGLAPTQLALFCGGRRLLGQASLRQAGDVRGGGTLRVVQRLAGGGAGAGRMHAPTTKQAAAARLAAEQAAAEEPARVAAEEAARSAAEQAAAEESAKVAAEDAARLATEQAAAEESARVAAEEAARSATVQAAAEESARLIVEQAEGARVAAEQAAAKEAARVVAEEAARSAVEQAAAEESARVAAEEAARSATVQAAAEESARLIAEQAEGARVAAEQAAAKEAARVAAEEAVRLEQAAAAPVAVAPVAALPPHLPPASEVAVGEEAMTKWKECGGAELEAVLKSGAVALLDAQWLIEHSKRGGVLLPRQALPDEAFISLRECQASTTRNTRFNVGCVSHCWLQPDHPDPHGHNLRAVARALGALTADGTRFGVFLDFCSIHQNCRDGAGTPQDTAFAWLEKEGRLANGAVGRFPTEDVLFKQALGSLGTLYSHPHTFVFMLTAFPPDYFTAKYTRSGNVKPYFERGWCFCESSWAAMVKDSFLVLDLGKDTGEGFFFALQCRQGRTAPVLPDGFETQLASKGFTNGSTDTPLVARLYREGFEARFGATSLLSYSRLGWGDVEARAVARVLLHAPALETLNLGDNSIGDEGARALAEALPRAPALHLLLLDCNSIGDEAKAVLRTAWGARGGLLIF